MEVKHIQNGDITIPSLTKYFINGDLSPKIYPVMVYDEESYSTIMVRYSDNHEIILPRDTFKKVMDRGITILCVMSDLLRYRGIDDVEEWITDTMRK